MFNFSELKTKVGDLAQRSETAYLTKIGVWLQLSHQMLSDIYDYWFDLQDIHNFTSVDGQENYPLPSRFDKPYRLYDFTNNKKITIKTDEEYTDGNITNVADATEGLPDIARIYGVSGSRVAISTSGKTVKAKSSATTETAITYVRVGGYVDTAHLIEDFETITIPLVTASTFVAGTKTFYKITYISKSTVTSGYITVADSDGTTLETLAPNERVARHKILKLGLIPDDSVTSYRLLFKKRALEMVNDYDYPFMECDRYLILDAYGWALRQDGKVQESEYTWNKATEALNILLLNANNKLGPDYQQKIVSKWAAAHRNIR